MFEAEAAAIWCQLGAESPIDTLVMVADLAGACHTFVLIFQFTKYIFNTDRGEK